MNEKLKPFEELWFLAQKSLEENFDNAELYETAFLDFLNFIKKHDELVESIKLYLCQIIEKGKIIPWELICFCMHELRWDEVFDSAKKRRESERNLHAQRLAELIMESYDDKWDGRVLFGYYSGTNQERGSGNRLTDSNHLK